MDTVPQKVEQRKYFMQSIGFFLKQMCLTQVDLYQYFRSKTLDIGLRNKALTFTLSIKKNQSVQIIDAPSLLI